MDPIFELDIDLSKPRDASLAETISRKLSHAIVGGRLQSGVKMPASRKLAETLNVSRNTVIDAYEQLISQGYLQTRQGDGTYVADGICGEIQSRFQERNYADRLAPYWRNKKASVDFPIQPTAQYTFRIGAPDLQHFPFDIWRKYVAKSLRYMEKNLDFHATAQGLESLRDAISKHVSISRAIACNGADILVTTGAQQALDILTRVLVTPGKTKVAVEQPGYLMAQNLFQSAGAILVPINTDKFGIKVDDIPTDVDLVYVTPSHQFPLGAAMSVQRRQALLDFATRHSVSVIEDDYDSDFRLMGNPLDALKTQDRDNCVFYIGTFSKNLLPDLKTGFVIAPQWAKNAMLAAKFQTDWGNSAIQQHTLAEFIQSGELFRHIRKMRKIYAKRYHVLKQAIGRHCGSYLELIPVHTGLHATALLNCGLDASQVSSVALSEGVSIRSIEAMCKTNQVPNGLIFGFGCIESDDIEHAMIILGNVLKRLVDSHNL